jgi:RNA polymerase sigma-70 factor (ECF subfamily)
MTKISEQDIQNWIKLSRDGDKIIYEKFLAYLCNYLEYVVSHKVKNDQVVHDIVQEVILAVHQSLKTYEQGRAFYPWLYSVMKYKIADYWRQVEKHKVSQLDEQNDIDKKSSVDPVEVQEVLDAISDLSQRDQRVFISTKILGHSINDVAAKEGLSQSNIKVIVHRAVKVIKEILHE